MLRLFVAEHGIEIRIVVQDRRGIAVHQCSDPGLRIAIAQGGDQRRSAYEIADVVAPDDEKARPSCNRPRGRLAGDHARTAAPETGTDLRRISTSLTTRPTSASSENCARCVAAAKGSKRNPPPRTSRRQRSKSAPPSSRGSR